MSYAKNKMKRMRTKYFNILWKDFGVVMAESPTNMVVICNGGLCNGVTHEMVCNTFERYGEVENVFMVPGKSYSFVKFKNNSSAVEAFNNINGQVVWPVIKGPVYLGFLVNESSLRLENSYNFKKPPGLILIENFITEEEEEFILGLIQFSNGENTLRHRRVKHYGYEFKYSTNNVDLSEPIEEIPKALNFLWEKLESHECQISFIPDQLTVNHYDPGQGIPPHVDTHSAFDDKIVSLSLQSSLVMEFRNQDRTCYSVILPRRSLCIMSGESRYDWTHGITPRKSDVIINTAGCLTVQNRGTRISLTFRKTREGECTCTFPRLCDSYLKKVKNETVGNLMNIKLEQEVAAKLEESYVHNVYEKIATHFSETRQKPWPNVMKFVKSFKTGSILVDVGCGNGKYFTKQTELFEIGCDSSNGLIQVCKEQGFECFSSNCLNLPLRDGVADGCICIAVIHHLSTEERRMTAVKEIVRILRRGGRALIYVWAKNQERDYKKSSYLKQSSSKEMTQNSPEVQFVSLNATQEELLLPVHVNRTNFNHNDLLVPWKLKIKEPEVSVEAPVYLRFYHVYEDDELEKSCRGLANIDVLDYYYDQGNWCIMLKKK